MGRLVALLVVAALSVGCSDGADGPRAGRDFAPSTTDPGDEWLARLDGSVDGTEITDVRVAGRVLKIVTDLGYAPDDPTRRGEATEVCFVARAEGWAGHIEVQANNGGPLAWTGADNSGCVGY